MSCPLHPPPPKRRDPAEPEYLIIRRPIEYWTGTGWTRGTRNAKRFTSAGDAEQDIAPGDLDATIIAI